MHFLGLAGMPRRIPDFPDVYLFWNQISSVGSFISFFGVFIFLFIIWRILSGKEAKWSLIGWNFNWKKTARYFIEVLMFRNKYTAVLLAKVLNKKLKSKKKKNKNINLFLNWYFTNHLILNRMSSHTLEWQTYSPPQTHCFKEIPIGVKMK